MSGRKFDEVWDRDLMKQQLGELRKETARLKAELARTRKAEEKTGRETSELRRLVQDGHLREKHLRSRYHELLMRSSGELAGAPVGGRQAAVPDDGGAGGAGGRPVERVDPSLVERAAQDETLDDGWPTPESTLPTLAAHPGWGNYASMGEAGVVMGISLLGLDHNARKEVIDLVAAQQLRNPQLVPLFITDDDDFRALRAEHFVFEYLPPWPGPQVVPTRERWESFLAGRLALIKKKWGVRRFVSFCSARYDAAEGQDPGAETVQRELADATKD